MQISIIFISTEIFVISLLSLQSRAQDTVFDDSHNGDGGRKDAESENSKYFSIKLRVSEIPGREFIRISGEKQEFVDTFNKVHKTVEFLGIPYAIPPLKNLRFQRPTLYIPERDFRAIEPAEPCPQIAINGAILGTEDCLHLNLYLPQGNESTTQPDGSSTEKLPVLVWFHGENPDSSADGKFGILNSGSAKELDPEIFLQHGIIVVTPQYRLGSLGFLSTVNEDLNGNMGLFDQLLSLEWVQRFISDFGGDPTQVTVMGHGSSAMTIGLIATSDLGKDLFHRLILMGGSPLSPVSLDPTPRLTFGESALQNACPSFPTLRFVRCMQQKEFEAIIRADDTNIKGKHIGKARVPLPVVQRDSDGRFLPPILSTAPSISLATGNFEHVPIILGVSSAEMSGFLSSIAGRELEELSSSIFASNTVLKQFVRAILGRGKNVDPELAADLVTFEYFSGLNVTDPARFEQAKDILEEVFSDFLFNIPALNFAKLWSRFAPVYFYVFDYVAKPEEEDDSDQMPNNTVKMDGMGPSGNQRQGFDSPNNLQASHGTDLRFLMRGYRGSAEDRQVANALVDFWVNFIHKGSPLHAGLDWPQFREDTKKYLLINEQVEVGSGFRSRQEYLWTDLIQDINHRRCSSGSSSSEFGPRDRKFNKNFKAFEKHSTPFNLPSRSTNIFETGGDETNLLSELEEAIQNS